MSQAPTQRVLPRGSGTVFGLGGPMDGQHRLTRARELRRVRVGVDDHWVRTLRRSSTPTRRNHTRLPVRMWAAWYPNSRAPSTTGVCRGQRCFSVLASRVLRAVKTRSVFLAEVALREMGNPTLLDLLAEAKAPKL